MNTGLSRLLLLGMALLTLSACSSMQTFQNADQSMAGHRGRISEAERQRKEALLEQQALEDQRIGVERDLERSRKARDDAASQVAALSRQRATAPPGRRAEIAALQARLRSAELKEQAARDAYKKSSGSAADIKKLQGTLDQLDVEFKQLQDAAALVR